MERKVFRSRVSVLLMAIILGIMLRPLISLIRSGNILHPAFYIIAGILVFVVLLCSGFRYEITDSHLRVSTWGTCSIRYPLSQIACVERSYNPLSSPAASLKRLEIRFMKGKKNWPFALISPAKEQEFLNTLKKINPNILIRVSDKKGWWRIWDWDI